MSNEAKPQWWRGHRGEWYVVTQVALIALVFLGPRTARGLPHWPVPIMIPAQIVGGCLMLAGISLLLAGLLRLGRNLTPLPYPKEGGSLVETGAYGIVRHPMYAGGIAIAYGWALLIHGWFTLIYATVLLVFLDFKADREERWLMTIYPGYPDYQRRVRKLIPFVR